MRARTAAGRARVLDRKGRLRRERRHARRGGPGARLAALFLRLGKRAPGQAGTGAAASPLAAEVAASLDDAAKRYRVTRSTGEVQLVTREEMEGLHRAHRQRIARAERLAWLIVRGPQLVGLVLLVLFLRNCVFVGEEAVPAPYGGGARDLGSERSVPAVESSSSLVSSPATAVAPAPAPPPAMALAPVDDGRALEAARSRLGTQQVRRAFERWLDAWRSRDVAAYLDSYGPAYASGGGSPRSWARDRRERLNSVPAIDIEVEEVAIALLGNDRARVTYLQRYRDALHADVSRKEVLFERIGLGWRIVEERSQPLDP